MKLKPGEQIGKMYCDNCGTEGPLEIPITGEPARDPAVTIYDDRVISVTGGPKGAMMCATCGGQTWHGNFRLPRAIGEREITLTTRERRTVRMALQTAANWNENMAGIIDGTASARHLRSRAQACRELKKRFGDKP